jgi:CRISPR-associated protein Cas2
MNKKDFLICYDIANIKRLSKIGKIVEKRALRIQKSIYLFDNASKEELSELIEAVMKIFHEKEDDLRIYTIKNKGIHLASAIDLENPLIF